MRYLNNIFENFNSVFLPPKLQHDETIVNNLPIFGRVEQVGPGTNVLAVGSLGDEFQIEFITSDATAISSRPVGRRDSINFAVGGASFRGRAESSVPEIAGVAVGVATDLSR
jgi:hypothetical protein